jgi:hypothetical protein
MRKPTLQEQVDGWKSFAFRLNFYRTISLDEAAVKAELAHIDAWVNSHSSHNGERPEHEIEANVAEAFWKHIAKAQPEPIKPAVKAPRVKKEKVK